MQFLKSLFCLQGIDNRPRFFAICSSIYLLFIMLLPIFSDNIFVFMLLLGLFTVTLASTTLRRIHDAKLNTKWLIAPCSTFVLIALSLVFFEQNNSYYLVIIPVLCSAVLLTYPSANKLNFILGYFGPVDMQEYQSETAHHKKTKFRIEPTLINTNPESLENTSHSTFQAHEFDKNDYVQDQATFKKPNDIGETIRLKLLTNKKAQLIISTVIGLILIAIATSWTVKFFNGANNVNEIKLKQPLVNFNPLFVREHPLAMPDNYTLYLSKHKGISIHWEADEVKDTTLWSQETAQGDASCKEISFNKGAPIRTLSVQVESSADEEGNKNYFAYFSPLDSKALIQALAFGNNFTLCGYDFSLKGSQAALGRNEEYAQWVDY